LNQVLTDQIWREVAKRSRAKMIRKAAIAYVTTDDIGMRAGDVLITDASERAIRSGQTDAKLLRRLHKAGVVIYSREGLHSKVALFGKHAIVGSANMSGSGLIEASVITDNPVIAAGVAAFIEALSKKPNKLDPERIEKLCAIEVVRTGRPKGGRRPKNPVR
jgi:phosphatidylserine/phosphatidylglycerophosphate/cardiolipin synthase-like enzyme